MKGVILCPSTFSQNKAKVQENTIHVTNVCKLCISSQYFHTTQLSATVHYSVYVLSRSAVSKSLQHHRPQPTRLLCPGLLHCKQIPEPPRMPIWHLAAAAKSLQSCPTLCDPIDGSPPGSILQFIFSETNHFHYRLLRMQVLLQNFLQHYN